MRWATGSKSSTTESRTSRAPQAVQRGRTEGAPILHSLASASVALLVVFFRQTFQRWRDEGRSVGYRAGYYLASIWRGCRQALSGSSTAVWY